MKRTGNEIAANIKEKYPEIKNIDLLLNTWYAETDMHKEQFLLLFKALKAEGNISDPCIILCCDELQTQFDKFMNKKKDELQH